MKRCGEIGSGAIAKVASNMLAFLNMAGGVECMALAKNAGLDLETFFDAIRASAGNSFAWETVMPVMFNGDYDPGFAMELACKDMWLAYNLGRDLQVPLPLHGQYPVESTRCFEIYFYNRYGRTNDANGKAEIWKSSRMLYLSQTSVGYCWNRYAC